MVNAVLALLALPAFASPPLDPIDAERLSRDLDTLVELVDEVHPDPFTVLPEAEFLARIEAIRADPEPRDALAFWRQLAPVVTALGDGHTHLDAWKHPLWTQRTDRKVPVSFVATDEGLAVQRVWNGLDGPPAGARVVSMDGHPAEEVRDRLLTYCPGEREAYRRSHVSRNGRELYAAVYGAGETLDLVTADAEGVETRWQLTTPPQQPPSAPVESEQKAYLGVRMQSVDGGVRLEHVVPGSAAAAGGLRMDDLVVAVGGEPVVGSDAVSAAIDSRRPGDLLPLTVLRGEASLELSIPLGGPMKPAPWAWMPLNDRIAYLDFRAFKDPEGFPAFLREMFEEMEEEGLEALVVDLRSNGGGNSALIDHLGAHVADEPFAQYARIDVRASPAVARLHGRRGSRSYRVFRRAWKTGDRVWSVPIEPALQAQTPHFDGPLVVLTSSWTFSSAADLASVAQDYGWGTLIGEETGGLATSFGDLYTVELPVSGLSLSISYKRFVRPSGLDNGRGVLPDIEVPEREALNTAIEHVETLLDAQSE